MKLVPPDARFHEKPLNRAKQLTRDSKPDGLSIGFPISRQFISPWKQELKFYFPGTLYKVKITIFNLPGFPAAYSGKRQMPKGQDSRDNGNGKSREVKPCCHCLSIYQETNCTSSQPKDQEEIDGLRCRIWSCHNFSNWRGIKGLQLQFQFLCLQPLAFHVKQWKRSSKTTGDSAMIEKRQTVASCNNVYLIRDWLNSINRDN
jgi:hypothetical protein